MHHDLGTDVGEQGGRDIGEHLAGAVIAVGIEIGGSEIGAVEGVVRIGLQRLLSEEGQRVEDPVLEKELGVDLTLRLGVEVGDDEAFEEPAAEEPVAEEAPEAPAAEESAEGSAATEPEAEQTADEPAAEEPAGKEEE